MHYTRGSQNLIYHIKLEFDRGSSHKGTLKIRVNAKFSISYSLCLKVNVTVF